MRCKRNRPSPTTDLQEVVVTGSRIIQTSANSQQPLSIIDRTAIERTGLASIGDLLQQVTASGKALNAKFNSSGNFGYPADGGGIGAGSAQVDLRNLGSKRVLVLVDGIRWVNESSASGVSGAADLNTIPMSIIERVEVLEDGASAIYGSDAIAGVINIITRKEVDGVELNAYRGEYEMGGPTTDASITVGGSGERFSGLFVASYYEQEEIGSGEWDQSSFPQPLAGLAAGSSGIPQGRYLFCDPSRPTGSSGSCSSADTFYNLALNNGTTTPVWNPANPTCGTSTYHGFTGADRFNYAPFNLLLTPSKRKAMFARMRFELSDSVSLYAKGLFNNRSSANQAAPEPIFVGPAAGTGGLADTISISALNPFNPFGIDLDAASNFGFVTRRPIEVGPAPVRAGRRHLVHQHGARRHLWLRQPFPLGSQPRELGEQRRPGVHQRLQHRAHPAGARRSRGVRADPELHTARPVRRPGPAVHAGDDRLHPHHADRLEQADPATGSAPMSPATCSTSATGPRASRWAPNIASTSASSCPIRCARPVNHRTRLHRP